MPCEAAHEEMLVYISEADVNVVHYLTQPHRLEMYPSRTSGKVVYFPDMRRQMADGAIEIIETKKSRTEVDRKPEYKQKLEWATECYARLGWQFRVLTAEDDLDVRPLLPNAKMIALDNKTAWRIEDLLRLRAAYERVGNTLSYGAAIAAMVSADRDEIDAKAMLHAMTVQRLVGIDITRRIDADSPVRLMEQLQ